MENRKCDMNEQEMQEVINTDEFDLLMAMENNDIVYDAETDTYGDCKDAVCYKCTRYQLDLCPGYEEMLRISEPEDYEDQEVEEEDINSEEMWNSIEMFRNEYKY